MNHDGIAESADGFIQERARITRQRAEADKRQQKREAFVAIACIIAILLMFVNFLVSDLERVNADEELEMLIPDEEEAAYDPCASPAQIRFQLEWQDRQNSITPSLQPHPTTTR